MKTKIFIPVVKYLADPIGDIKAEIRLLKEYYKERKIKLDIKEIPGYRDDGYDILFFDWGGMMIGNSILQHTCDYIIRNAKNNPSKIFIMTSRFTEEAMKDALNILKEDGEEIPHNVFLHPKFSFQSIRDLIEERIL